MSTRARRFGSVAAAYERYRPGYPDALVERVLAYAGRRVRTALEIGAGTGKATRAFAAHGVRVTATEPDAAMLAELRRHVPPSVTPVRASLETLATDERFDLVHAAAALHWTDPAQRWPRVAALLVPGGAFASFGGPVGLADPDLEAAVRAARGDVLPSDEVPSPDGTPSGAALQWPGTELARSPLFTDVRQERLPRRLTWPADDYVGLLGTVSAYLGLPDDARTALLARVRTALPDQVEVVVDLTLHLARLAPPTLTRRL
ncbi:class I SAM-dependent methyltransferase [Nocardioides marinquilinus]|uniref:Class I SAM-dependent methyltransferase n=1 Tax=Nocardioides marinquilinus TaxID=1210400 RepID=A0ABP9Q2L9_9ACTN